MCRDPEEDLSEVSSRAGEVNQSQPLRFEAECTGPYPLQPDKPQDFEGSNRQDICKGRLVGVAFAVVWLGMTEVLQDSNAPLGNTLGYYLHRDNVSPTT